MAIRNFVYIYNIIIGVLKVICLTAEIKPVGLIR